VAERQWVGFVRGVVGFDGHGLGGRECGSWGLLKEFGGHTTREKQRGSDQLTRNGRDYGRREPVALVTTVGKKI